MNDIGGLALSLAGGLALGALFFGGLWWTVSRLPVFEHPALVVTVSTLLRTGATVGGFFLLSAGHWQRFLACLAGFALARLMSHWAMRRAPPPSSVPAALHPKGSA